MARLPPFIALRALEAAARLQSYSRAADELSVTHGAVSQQIRRLEEELGTVLFHREGNRMVPTPEASRLAGDVAGAIRALQSGVDALRADANTLVISTLAHFAGRWLAPRLTRLAESAPNMRIEIRVGDGLSTLGPDGVDLALRYGPGVYPRCQSELLFAESQFPVCAPSVLERHPIRTPEDLLTAPLLVHKTRPWAYWFKSVGLKAPAPVGGIVFDDTGMLIDAAVQGLGVALARGPFVEHDLASGRLVRPLREATAGEWSYFAVWRPESRKLPLIRAFVDWLRSEIALSADLREG